MVSRTSFVFVTGIHGIPDLTGENGRQTLMENCLSTTLARAIVLRCTTLSTELLRCFKLLYAQIPFEHTRK